MARGAPLCYSLRGMKMFNSKAAAAAYALAGVLAAALVAACSSNTSGDLSATHTGDLSHPFAERAAPGADMTAACGTGLPTAAGAQDLARRPYLQLVGDRTATVVWVSAGGDAGDVELSRPDGTVLDTVQAAPAGVAPNGTELRATFNSLQPGTLYCYTVRGDSEPLVTRTGFRTAPAAGSDAPIRFVAFGDSGEGGLDQEVVLEQMETVPLRLHDPPRRHRL
jgi:hypothetical protein